jgi:hypothetical protein
MLVPKTASQVLYVKKLLDARQKKLEQEAEQEAEVERRLAERMKGMKMDTD